MERENRLLFVANGKKGSRSCRLREFIGNDFQDLPLRFASVLRLIKQYMIELLVEFIKNPGGAGPPKQGPRALNQIIEVEKTAMILHMLVIGNNLFADYRQGLRD